MDGKTSFIPRGQMTTSFEANKKSSKVSLFLLVSIIIFIVSLVLAGGVYFLSEYKAKAIKDKIDSLERAKGSFEPALIEQLSNLDVRINSAQKVLDGHISVSSFFKLLEQTTLKTVRFNEFEFTQRGDGSFFVTMRGEADSYSSVALQSDMFAGNKYVQEPIFSGFKLNSKGNVLFDFSAAIDKSLILYENNLEK
ncbi:MAG: hypothetical protein WC849_03140 [Candidatus Paceibacterota bacterium]